MQFNRFSILFYLLFISPVITTGQLKNISPLKRCPVNTINFEQGLLNNGTNSIVTDGLGFTWISTKTGIQRFNGSTLDDVIPLVNKQNIHINYPVFLFALQNGNLWISYNQGVLEYDPYRNTFARVLSYPLSGNNFFSIVPMQETKAGIWCLQERKGIVIYDRRGVQKEIIPFINPAFSDSLLLSLDILYNTLSTADDHYIFIQNFNDKYIYN